MIGGLKWGRPAGAYCSSRTVRPHGDRGGLRTNRHPRSMGFPDGSVLENLDVIDGPAINAGYALVGAGTAGLVATGG